MAGIIALACLSTLWCGELRVRFNFEDVERFEAAMSMPGTFENCVEQKYLRPGSFAVKAFTPLRMIGAEALAHAVRQRPESYRGLRRKAETIRSQIPAMEQVMRNLQRRYLGARFPDVWFVVGRGNTAGLAHEQGMILAIEHEATAPESIVALFSHELIHYQQKGRPRTLLDYALHEGAADFLGEILCGKLTPHAAETMRLASRRADFFRSEFWKDARANANHGRWLFNYGSGTRSWPSDLGYWIGYGIAEGFFRQAIDQNRAFGELLEAVDYGRIVERSLTPR